MLKEDKKHKWTLMRLKDDVKNKIRGNSFTIHYYTFHWIFLSYGLTAWQDRWSRKLLIGFLWTKSSYIHRFQTALLVDLRIVKKCLRIQQQGSEHPNSGISGAAYAKVSRRVQALGSSVGSKERFCYFLKCLKVLSHNFKILPWNLWWSKNLF